MSQAQDDTPPTRYRNNYSNTGRALVITNLFLDYKKGQRFVEDEHQRTVANLKSIGFQVTQKKDQSIDEMRELVKNVAKEDYSDCDCFLAVFSSHGDWSDFAEAAGDWTERRQRHNADVILGANGQRAPIGELAQYLKPHHAHPSLIGKPKIFLLQCCRGDQIEVSVIVPTDQESGQIVGSASVEPGHRIHPGAETEAGIPYSIPIWKDFFFHFCTTPGHFAWKKGRPNNKVRIDSSPFLDAWFEVLAGDLERNHLRDLATIVNGKVVDNYTSRNDEKQEYSNRKQIPQIVSMLCKDFYLKKKFLSN